MKTMTLTMLVSVMLIQAVNAYAAPDQKTATWEDAQARFTLIVTEGTKEFPLIAEITIVNKTDNALSFPTPFVMPLCGNTNKNNIRVFDEADKELDINSLIIHGDLAGRPKTEIPAKTSKMWKFNLDVLFPKLANPGKYSIEFWYFSDENDEATWKGRVKMDRLTVERK